MTSAHTLHTIRLWIGILGNFTSFMLFFSPMLTIYRIHEKKSVEGFHPYPYLAAVLNCAFWIFYGLPFNHPDSTLVITINSIGFVLEVFYILIFLYYADNKMRAKIGAVFAAQVVFFSGMAVIDILRFHTHAKRSMFVGILSIGFGIVLYGSPLSVTRRVLKTKSSEFLPLWVCFSGFINGLVWAIYALILKIDPYILIGNGVGSLFGLFQLIVWFWYRPKGGNIAAEKSSEGGDIAAEKSSEGGDIAAQKSEIELPV